MTKQQTDWVIYTGSDEQIAELQNAQYGVLLDGIDEILDVSDMVSLQSYMIANRIYKYWIIPDDPLREMKIRQAMTGQPVYIKTDDWSIPLTGNRGMLTAQCDDTYMVFVTTKPNWNIPNAEYSFTPWED